MPAIQEKVVEDLKEELSKEVVWPNRLILPLSSAADARQVREMQQVSRCFLRCGNLNQEGFFAPGFAL